MVKKIKQRNILIGAGGHAKAILAGLHAQGQSVEAVVDKNYPAWLERFFETDRKPIHLKNDEDGLKFLRDDSDLNIILGLGGITPDQLARRLIVFLDYLKLNPRSAKPFVLSSASISEYASIGVGVVVLSRAVIQPDVIIDMASIINTGAIVEHDSRIGKGSHIAPGAVVLGGATIGDNCLVGAGATVLPGATVPDNMLVPANSIAR